ncbi:MAG: hypothetical protein LUE15_08435 [Oscillospiraceae bacterium]|nr:hypothetical protein [Oscillospiraceae bacterium]
MLDKKRRFWLWLLALFRKDMDNFKEGEDDKQKIYNSVTQYIKEERE